MNWKKFSRPPTTRPAMIAPGMLPSPPITVTISPLTVKGRDSSGDSMPIAAPVMAPAIPPTTPVMVKVRTFTRAMLMPQSSDAVGCCDTARVASEEHTSELQSHHDIVCRLLLEKKKKKTQ